MNRSNPTCLGLTDNITLHPESMLIQCVSNPL
jgi:hypothetical protein